MTETQAPTDQDTLDEEARKKLEEIDYSGHKHGHKTAIFVGLIAFSWSVFQLWIASPLDSSLWLVAMQKRGIHLAFGFLLCF
ncbi:MAG: hypothetical protein OEY85_09005, partial [Rhodospirillales bacterium]|nr:hypothetical protein [Rhodospirillales bacterium]